MTDKTRSYEAADVVVKYDVARCIHAAECVHGLPSVFDPERRPWIDPSGASADEVTRVIERCPTGALTYRRKDGGDGEAVPERNVVRLTPEGPLHARGRLRIRTADGRELEETRVALCRCGHSANKPFCDGAHTKAGFDDPGRVAEARLKEGDEPAEAELEINLAENGPILLSGPFEVIGADGSSRSGVGGALCRCGQSSTKPFCDGTHRTAGFSAGGSG